MLFDFGIKDLIDIFCVAFLLYYFYKMMKASGSLNVFYGILVFIIIWVVVSQVAEMRLLGSIFDQFVSVGVIALIILFQDIIPQSPAFAKRFPSAWPKITIAFFCIYATISR